ncbi:hypothetical protein F5878DRAFT_724409 [Lentinula raphanica]|uniref:Uncharacterized protein n=1 Tax=Lentinula raphanica TaxID=153919 RepID=A0AA38PBE5_9AGAR|nr:hypothetical protein F5880DRAFT_1592633 [Lentinula raphanica]KAJ3839575.1 hypothetical protein F5878DRAFT_724409 [Lentinula raphanica]
MVKNRALFNPNQQAPVMSPPHTHTVTIVAEDDDDNDICPVCDGQCTCSNNAASFYQQPPPPTRLPSPAHDPPRTILKIKLPPNFLKQKLSQSSQISSGPSVSSSPSFPTPSSSNLSQPIPKRRGRPPKSSAPRRGPGIAGPSTSGYQRPDLHTSVSRNRTLPGKISKTSNARVRKTAIRKRKRVESSNESSSSELTDIDHPYASHSSHHAVNNEDDAQSVQFPTFVSAISSDSSASSSDSDLTSGFETDSSIEAEEENFILAEERARVRRELLNGSGEETMQKRRDTNWVIRPRQMSVGAPSDIDMDEDSDATEEADDDDDDQEDDDEPDGDDMENADARRHGYAGIVSAWSDDEESSFDADLFFANLSDKDSDSSGSSTQSDDGEDGDYSELEFEVSRTAASLVPHLRQGVGIGIPNLAFEVTEGWDGQIVFTNGQTESSSQDGLQGLLGAPFLPQGPDTSPSPGPDFDVDMLSTDADGEADEAGYEQDIDQDTAEAEGEGDTTDEELVGEDDLPNERAMSLFNTPFKFSHVSSINPMSTLSPGSSPISTFRRGSNLGTDSPLPGDILSQSMEWDSHRSGGDEPEEEEEESAFVREQREKDKEARGGLPRTGFFEVVAETRQIVIDGDQKEIPSSYPRFTGRRGKGVKSMSLSMSRAGRSGGFESLLRKSFRPSSLPPSLPRNNFLSASISPLSPSSEVPEESSSLAPSVDITSPGSTSESQSENPVMQPMSIDLDDVLDASYLVSTESTTIPNVIEAPPAESSVAIHNSDASPSTDQYIKSFNRWDVISVGALRKTGALTDSAPGWGSDSGPDYTAYSNVMKSSPLSTMLWHNRNSSSRQQRSMGYMLSPELGPMRDGDRTPTNSSQKHNGSPPSNSKSRQELRRERKLKRKSHKPVNHHKQQHLHHQHHHHPNSKTRSTSSFQRSNAFNNSPVPSLSI